MLDTVMPSIETTGQAKNGFKETEIGEIPAEWEVKLLKEVVHFSQKPRGLNISRYEQVPFIPMEMIPDNGLHVTAYEPKAGKEIRSGTYFELGDFLLAKITPSFENGKQGIPVKLPLSFGYATTEVYPLKAKSDCLDQLFLFYFFRQPGVRAGIAAKMEGSTGRQRVPKYVIETCPIPHPPLPEQRRIAAALSAIQRAIAAQDDVIAAAKEVKRSLMQRLFTNGPGREPAETKETEIGEIPAHWEVVLLKDIAQKPQYGYTESASEQPVGPKFLRITDIGDQGVHWPSVPYCACPPNQVPKYLLQDDDIIFARTGATTGKSYIIKDCPEAVFASYLIRVRIKEGTHPDFVYHYFNTDSYWDQVNRAKTGAAQAGINGTRLQNLYIPIAPLSEQIAISNIIASADTKIAAEQDRKTALEALFCSTLHRLMTGQVRLLHDEGLPLDNQLLDTA